jgi:hypothetical protein
MQEIPSDIGLVDTSTTLGAVLSYLSQLPEWSQVVILLILILRVFGPDTAALVSDKLPGMSILNKLVGNYGKAGNDAGKQ